MTPTFVVVVGAGVVVGGVGFVVVGVGVGCQLSIVC